MSFERHHEAQTVGHRRNNWPFEPQVASAHSTTRYIIIEEKGPKRRSRYNGWRAGLLVACCFSVFVLLCNIVLAIVATTKDREVNSASVAIPMTARDPDQISRWNIVANIAINAFSTDLLSASNYTMQVLCSPKERNRHSSWTLRMGHRMVPLRAESRYSVL